MRPVEQGDLTLLEQPASQELLQSKIPARLAYIWTDGTPRVVPIWFHWNGRDIVMASPPKATKLKALAKNPKVSLTIDDNTFPHKVLMIRGTARMEPVDGIVPEYAAIFWSHPRRGLAESTANDDFIDGAHYDHPRVGWPSGFPDPFSERAGQLSCRGIHRV